MRKYLVFTVSLLSAVGMLAGCSQAADDSSSKSESSAVSSAAEVSSEKTTSAPSETESNGSDVTTSEFEPIRPVRVGFSTVSDNELLSDDGMISCSYTYEMSENADSIDFTIVTENRSDKEVCLSVTPGKYYYTDLTEDPDATRNANSMLETHTIAANDKYEEHLKIDFEEGWSTAHIELKIGATSYSEYDSDYDFTDGEAIYKGGERFILDFTKTADGADLTSLSYS